MTIRKIKARKIYDSQSKLTLEVDLITDIGLFRTSVPNDLRPNPSGLRQLGDDAVDIVNNVIGPELIQANFDINRQKDIDRFLVQLDGTDDKSKLGSAAMFAVSAACCKAAATKANTPIYKYIANLAGNNQLPIPVPAFCVINGGLLANNQLTFRDFYVLPYGASDFEEALAIGNQVYRAVGEKIAQVDEVSQPLPISSIGGFVPQSLEDDAAAIQIIEEAIQSLGLKDKVKIHINVDATTFFTEDTGTYNLNYKSSEEDEEDEKSPDELKESYAALVKQFPSVISIEDPFGAEDWDSWPLMMDQKLQIVCNEAAAMISDRIQEMVERGGANSLVVEPWRAGTLTESLVAAKLAQSNDWDLVVSAGFGETEDNFLADFAVGVSACIFKAGGTGRSAKYNHLMRVEKERGKLSKYSGDKFSIYGL